MMRSDITIFGQNGEPVLLVEVKGRKGTSKSWAAELRKNLMENVLIPPAPFFLIATPDRFYLWKRSRNGTDDHEPDYQGDAANAYQSDNATRGIGSLALELRVAAWLADMIAGSEDTTYPDWVRSSGLRAALRYGRLAFEHAA